MVCSKALGVLLALSVVQYAAAFSANELHEKLKSLDSEKLQKLESKLSAHLEKQSAGLNANELHEQLKSLDAEDLKKASVKLAEHIKTQSENAESTDLRKKGPLRTLLDKILGNKKLHEKLKAINPEALEKLESKLSAHLEKQSAGLTASELHEKIKNEVQLQKKLSEHIKEKLSEGISKKTAEASKRSAADCTSSITDIVTQVEALIQAVVKIRTAGLTILQEVSQCASSGPTTAASCLTGLLSSAQGTTQALVSSIQQAVQGIQSDVGKLASCAPTAG